MAKIKVAVMGIGNVGGGLYNLLEENKGLYKNTFSIEIVKVLVRDINKPRDIALPDGILTENFDDIIADDIDIVVELIGGLHPAYEYILAALKAGKSVVTANKAIMATYGIELFDIANKYGVALKYEASVCGGIPVIETLNRSLASNRINEVIGILNGTTNYILSDMYLNGSDFDDTLAQAQALGFAEADPTSDICGDDAVYKISILAKCAFGADVSPEDIPKEGITNITSADIEFAKSSNYAIKLLATAKNYDNKLEIHVIPSLVSNTNPIATVNGVYNALLIRGNGVGDLMLYGKGAGDYPTGSAVLSDIISLAKDIVLKREPEPSIFVQASNIEMVGEGEGEFYIRLIALDTPGVLGKIATTFGKLNLSLASVVQKGRANDDEYVDIMFITHKVDRNLLDKALNSLSKEDAVQKIACILRVFE